MENVSTFIKQYQNKMKDLNEKITSYADKYKELMDQVGEIELNEEENKSKGKNEEEIMENLKNVIKKKKPKYQFKNTKRKIGEKRKY